MRDGLTGPPVPAAVRGAMPALIVCAGLLQFSTSDWWPPQGVTARSLQRTLEKYPLSLLRCLSSSLRPSLLASGSRLCAHLGLVRLGLFRTAPFF